MDHLEAGRYWESNAEAWTRLARAGYDHYRDNLNTPAFLDLLPPISSLSGLDLGCGEGHNTRLLAQLGPARLAAFDISPTFIRHAQQAEADSPLGIRYLVASAVALPFADASFDFATSFMCFMDVPETALLFSESFRVLRPGGFLQFSICHPCFDTPHRRNLRDATGNTYAIEVGRYFDSQHGAIAEWTFSAAPPPVTAGLPKFRVPNFHRPLSSWVNLLLESGFLLSRLAEPTPTPAQVLADPRLQDNTVTPHFLHFLARKPGPQPSLPAPLDLVG
jgi:SAM-dependent methyltransferase